MIITVQPGEVIKDCIAVLRPSSQYQLTFKSDWDYGLSVMINGVVLNHYECGDNMVFNNTPVIHATNAGTDHVITMEVSRIGHSI